MRLIDADARIDDLMERYCKECNKRKGMKNGKRQFIYEIGGAPCRACEVDDVKAEFEEAPDIDVPDRNVGEWMAEPNCWYRCSNCGQHYPSIRGYMDYKYCPSCGARMERSEE